MRQSGGFCTGSPLKSVHRLAVRWAGADAPRGTCFSARTLGATHRVRALQGRRPGRKPGQNAGGEGYTVIGESPRIAWGTLMAYWCLVPSGPLCPPSLMVN